MLTNKPARVLLLESSAVFRRLLVQELSRDIQIEIAGNMIDAMYAWQQLASLNPDVIVLDVDSSPTQGLPFLKRLMSDRPLPVIAMASRNPAGVENAMNALDAGAIDVIFKPDSKIPFLQMANCLQQKVKKTRHANVSKLPASIHPEISIPQLGNLSPGKILAIGASVGGVQAVTQVLAQLPINAPATLVVQQLPAALTKAFAERLSRQCKVKVREAVDGDVVCQGFALIAPGGSHMLLQKEGDQYRVRIKDGPELDSQKPSIDVLFNSIAKVAGPNAIGALLTSDGVDGVAGLKNMRIAGEHTLVQDEQTSVSFGTAQEAIRRGAAERVVPLWEMVPTMLSFVAA